MKFSFFFFFGTICCLESFCQSYTKSNLFDRKDTLTYEKVYLHTDKDNYLAGEIVWFKAYLFDLKYNNPGRLSKTLYVELISPSSKIIKTRIILLENGLGKGDINIPDSSESGIWQIRAYTAWMQNFGNCFVFSKKIQIANSKSLKNKIPVKNENMEYWGFYPESGSMIENVRSYVAFKASDKNEEGLDVDGFIVSSNNDTVCKVVSSHLGMGKFRFCPLKGQTYFFIGNINHKVFKSELPKILSIGYILEISDKNSLDKSIIVKTNPNTLPEGSMQNMYLSISYENKELLKIAANIKNLQTSLLLPKKGLPEGIVSITLFDENKLPLAERIFYNEIKDSLNFTLESDKKSYATREKVELNILSDSLMNDFKGASLSLSVTNKSFNPMIQSNIKIYKNLESELKGRIEKPQMYFDTQNPDRLKQLDLLLMVQGWRNYIWKEVRDTSFKIKYFLERGFTFKGVVNQRFGKKTLMNANLTLYMAQDSQYVFYKTHSDSMGRFSFRNLKIYNKQLVKISLRNSKLKETGCLNIPNKWEHQPLEIIPENQYRYRKDSTIRIVMQERRKIVKQYKLTDTIELEEVVVKASNVKNIMDTVSRLKLLKTYDLSVKPQDSSFYNLKYYLIKNISESRIRAKNHYVTSYFDIQNGEAANQDYTDPNETDFMFDSPQKKSMFVMQIGTSDQENLGNWISPNSYDYYLAMPMKNFGKVKINKYLSIKGKFSTNLYNYYQVLLFLKPEAYNTCTSYSTLVTGYNFAKEFYSPHYDVDNNSTKPDLRTTIYWAPDITTDNKGCAHISF